MRKSAEADQIERDRVAAIALDEEIKESDSKRVSAEAEKREREEILMIAREKERQEADSRRLSVEAEGRETSRVAALEREKDQSAKRHSIEVERRERERMEILKKERDSRVALRKSEELVRAQQIELDEFRRQVREAERTGEVARGDDTTRIQEEVRIEQEYDQLDKTHVPTARPVSSVGRIGKTTDPTRGNDDLEPELEWYRAQECHRRLTPTEYARQGEVLEMLAYRDHKQSEVEKIQAMAEQVDRMSRNYHSGKTDPPAGTSVGPAGSIEGKPIGNSGYQVGSTHGQQGMTEPNRYVRSSRSGSHTMQSLGMNYEVGGAEN